MWARLGRHDGVIEVRRMLCFSIQNTHTYIYIYCTLIHVLCVYIYIKEELLIGIMTLSINSYICWLFWQHPCTAKPWKQIQTHSFLRSSHLASGWIRLVQSVRGCLGHNLFFVGIWSFARVLRGLLVGPDWNHWVNFQTEANIAYEHRMATEPRPRTST